MDLCVDMKLFNNRFEINIREGSWRHPDEWVFLINKDCVDHEVGKHGCVIVECGWITFSFYAKKYLPNHDIDDEFDDD